MIIVVFIKLARSGDSLSYQRRLGWEWTEHWGGRESEGTGDMRDVSPRGLILSSLSALVSGLSLSSVPDG